MNSFIGRQIEEASSRRPAVEPPTPFSVPRRGYASGIPLGGATEDNPAQSTTSGALNRGAWMDQLFQGYLACPWVSACVDITASTATAGGVQVAPNTYENAYSPQADALLVPTAPPGVQRVKDLFAFTNPTDDIRQIMRNVIVDVNVFGDAFVEVVWLLGQPVALYILDARTMSILTDAHGNLRGYEQQTENGNKVFFAPREVIHIKMDAPGGGIYGVSPTQKLITPITIWLFTTALIQENMRRGDPARLWVDWPIALPESERKKLEQQFLIRNLGAKNIGNLFETKGETMVKELQVNRTVDWLSVNSQTRDVIVSGFGVPPQKVGITEGSSMGDGGGTASDRTFNISKVGPISELVLNAFSFALLYQAFGIQDWRCQFGRVDWRDDLIIDQIIDMRIRNGTYTLNKARSIYGEPPVKGGDVPILVDRQNLVEWEDLDALSKANVAAISAKGTAPTAAPGGPGPAPAPGANGNASAPNGPGSEGYANGSHYYPNRSEYLAGSKLRSAWDDSYAKLHEQAIKELERYGG